MVRGFIPATARSPRVRRHRSPRRVGRTWWLGALFACGLLFVATSAEAGNEATRGQQLLQDKGCLACHSMDGSPRSGPTFQGSWGKTRAVVTPAGARDVAVDDLYFARSVRDPDSEVAAGYKSGVMPKLDVSDDELAAMAEAIRHPEAIDPSRARRGGTLIPLVGSCLAFVLLHFLLSASAVRRQMIAAMGEKGFRLVYSLLALASFAGMIVFYRTAPFYELWSPPRWTRWVPVLVMPIAILFMVAGFSTPSATSVGQETKAKDNPVGILAVTRHPAMWGFALWALGHLAANGELHVVLVAASILVLAIGGTAHIDMRRRATLGAEWEAYEGKTSFWPFVAMAQGRARLQPSQIGVARVLVSVALYVALFFAHPHVIGASPHP